jgi:multidrug resistance protein MdtO
MRSEANFLRLIQTSMQHDELLRQADTLRDRIGKTVAAIRSMNEAVEYEFGVDRARHALSGQMIIAAALTSVAFFWNQFAVLHSEHNRDFLTQPALAQMRQQLAAEMDVMADAIVQKTEFTLAQPAAMLDSALLADPRYGEYARNSVARFDELQTIVSRLRTQA